MNKTHPIVLLLAAVLVTCPGCVKKFIGVRSEPPGATVYIDGREVGRTPVDYIPFDFYGTREFALYKGGYLAERRVVEIDTPWYSCFPIDIFSELIIPWDIADRRTYYFALKRAEPVERDALMRHAYQTRDVANARIDGARREANYKPRAYVVKGAEKPFVLWGWLVVPPRGKPIYKEPVEPEEELEEEPEEPR